MATRAPPVGLDHPTVVPTNLHRRDERDDSDERTADDRSDDEHCVHGD